MPYFPGKAKGHLIGGNLAILSSLVGTPYFPDLKGAILFIEDVGEEIYRLDRMLTQLKNSGQLDGINGFIFGHCTDCQSYVANKDSRGGFFFYALIKQHIELLGVPAFIGADFGHSGGMFILPEGLEVEIDATQGQIKMLTSAVLNQAPPA